MPIRDSCDRHPSALALTAWYRPTDRSVVVLCGHCAHLHEWALIEQQFELAMDERPGLTPDREPEPA